MKKLNKFVSAVLAVSLSASVLTGSILPSCAKIPEAASLSGATQNITKELTTGVRYTKTTSDANSLYGGSSGIEFNIVEADMSANNLYLDTVYGGDRSTHAYKTGTTIVSNFANKNSDFTPIAAINADLWWLYTGSATEAANGGEKLLSNTNGHSFSLGFTMSNGEIYTSDKMPQESFITPSESTVDLPYTDLMAFGITNDSIPVISNPDALVTIKNTTKGITATADGINRMPAYDSLVMYTDKGPLNNYANDDALEIVIDITSTPDYVIKHGASISGKVIGIYDSDDLSNPTMDLNSNRIILTARGDRTMLLSKYAINDVIRIDVSVYDQWGKYTEEWQRVTDAVSGHIPFAVDGVYHSSIGLEADYPATVIGITNSGNVIMLTLGSTSSGRKGIDPSLYDDLAKDLDLRDAFLLDGGGSSTMVLLEGSEYKVVNNPSDGSERQVLNMLVLSTGPSHSEQGTIDVASECDSNAVKIDFSKPSNMFYVNGNASSSTKCTYDNGALRLTAASSYDPYITFNYMNTNPRITANNYKYIIIEYMLPESNSSTARQGQLFFQCGALDYADPDYSKMTSLLVRTGVYKKLIVDVSNQTGWAGVLNGLRFDYFNKCKSGDTMYIKSITLSATKPVSSSSPITTATSKPTTTATSSITATVSTIATPTVKPSTTATVAESTATVTSKPIETVTSKPTNTSSGIVPSATAATQETTTHTPTDRTETVLNVEIANAGENKFATGTKLLVQPLEQNASIISSIANTIGSEYDYILADLILVNNGEEIELTGDVQISIDLPEGYTGDKTKVYLASVDGTLTPVDTEYSDGRLTFRTDTLGAIAVINETSETPVESVTQSPSSTAGQTSDDEVTPTSYVTASTGDREGGETDKENTDDKDGLSKTAIVLIVIAGIAVIGGAAAVIIIVFKKKKNA